MLSDRLDHVAALDHDLLVSELAALIAHAPTAEGSRSDAAAELEHLAAHLLVLLEQSPGGRVGLFLDALAERAALGDERCASLLAALGTLAGGGTPPSDPGSLRARR